MAKGAFNLNDFKAEVLGKYGLAKTNRFEVLIFPPPALSMNYGRMVSILVEQAFFPLVGVNSKSFKTFGPGHQRPVGIEYGGEGINMSIHLDGRMNVKTFLDDWIHLVVNPNDFTVNYQDNYISRIVVRQLDEQNNVTYEVEIYEAFPRSISQITVDNSSQSQTSRVNVLFSYRYWKERKDKRLSDVPLYISQPQIPRDVSSN